MESISSQWGAKAAKFLVMAEWLSWQSPMRFKHGAVLVKNGKPIGKGYNCERALFRRREITSMHAEIMTLNRLNLSNTAGSSWALLDIIFNIDNWTILYTNSSFAFLGSDLYIVRSTETGLGNSKPCEDCLVILKRFKVKNVFYSTRKGIFKERVDDMVGYLQKHRPNQTYDRYVLQPKPP